MTWNSFVISQTAHFRIQEKSECVLSGCDSLIVSTSYFLVLDLSFFQGLHVILLKISRWVPKTISESFYSRRQWLIRWIPKKLQMEIHLGTLWIFFFFFFFFWCSDLRRRCWFYVSASGIRKCFQSSLSFRVGEGGPFQHVKKCITLSKTTSSITLLVGIW